MFLAFWLALRYFRARRRGLARFTALVAVTGVAAGVASLIFVQALAQGFADEMRDKILEHTAHLSVTRADGEPIPDWENATERVRGVKGVREVLPTSYANVLLIRDAESSSAMLRAVPSPETNDHAANDAVIGVRLAEKLGLRVGDTAEILTLEKREPVRIRVARTFETGIYEFDSARIDVSPALYAFAQGRDEFVPSTLQVKVVDIYEVAAESAAIRQLLGSEYTVIDWREANKPLFAALSLERKAALAIIAVIVLIAALNITTTLALNAAERRRDIAILKTCGATSGTIAAMFVTEGMILGLIGVALGVAIGLASCIAANQLRLISLPPDVYSISQITLRPGVEFAVIACLSALALCLAATLFPALRASRVKPADILRTS